MFPRTGKKPEPRPSPAVSLALAGNMITQEEYRACLRGEMEVLRLNMEDENSHGLVIRKITMKTSGVSYSPTIRLYHNRADDVLIDRMLGQE